ncbi:hypothetical protein C1H76_6228 [Elsinoe australis]|uniref:SMODS and SLOG-associating 2TM effector domain-containing protein n=1 Tax=Elsinoe australis TaxID=40998 RepID=A0A4V6DTR6_9PEZI|nr:hypothetical protein C1H76_6228 [Elsinoe australis]
MPSNHPDLRTPLLQFSPSPTTTGTTTHHTEFCTLIGMPPLPHPSLPPPPSTHPHPSTLYQRARRALRAQTLTYLFTATLSNTLLLSQVVLGAALTALGASSSSHVLITIFGAANTIIAGLVAYLKSRGQPMRARMYREDLERLVDEIEASGTMWLGISTGSHGYDAIDVEERVTVRGEVARLTRLWDQAVKRSLSNDPDMYAAGAVGDGGEGGLKVGWRGKVGGAGSAGPAAGGAPVVGMAPSPGAVTGPVEAGTVPPAAAVSGDPDESPAKSDLKDGKKVEVPVVVVEEEGKGEKGKEVPGGEKVAEDPVVDPDASPAAATGEEVAAKKKEKEGAGDGALLGQKANESLKRMPSGSAPGGSTPGGFIS